MTSERRSFSSGWALMFAMLSMAVGTGNIWRFPRELVNNGGGSFLIPWVVFLFAWSIPLILTELAIGRAARCGPMAAFVKLVSPKLAWMGAWITLVSVAIMFYYSVVAGWTLRYLAASVTGELKAGDAEYYERFFSDFIDGYEPMAMHVIVLAAALFVIYRGVGAIERVTSIMLPTLVLLVAILAVRALFLDGASEGLRFIFTVQPEKLASARTWLAALTQNAWDTGAGWGLITCYAIYMRREDDSSVNGFFLGIGNNSVSMMAGIAVVCTMVSIRPDAVTAISAGRGEGLTFIWIPQLFMRMWGGQVFMVFFFAALFMAAWTSLIAMVELAARALEDVGVNRRAGVAIVGVLALVGGLPSAFSIDVLHNQDWVWGLALIVSGLFFAVAVIRHGAARFRTSLVNIAGNRIPIGRWWEWVLVVGVPVQAIALVAWWLASTWPAPGEQSFNERMHAWLWPISPENTGTVLAQWAVLLVVLLAINAPAVRLVMRAAREEAR